MPTRTTIAVLTSIILLSVLFVPASPNYPNVKAIGTPAAGVSGYTTSAPAAQYGHNLTSLTGLGQGTQFTVNVNVTNVGPLSGFDVTIRYTISSSLPSIISVVPNTATFNGGLFDPSANLPPGCSVLPVKVDVRQPPVNTIRLAAVIQGSCTVGGPTGTGVLFSATFQVLDYGGTAIDIVEGADSGGTQKLQIISGSGDHQLVPVQIYNAYFRNKAGVPPVARFTYTPPAPILGQTVTFNGTLSYDPENPGGPSKGIAKYIWEYGDNSLADQGATVNNPTHIFRVEPTVPVAGTFQVRLIVVDTDNGLPMRVTQLVKISIPIVHDLAVTISADKDQVNVGDTIHVTVTVYNRGNRNEQASLVVKYDYGPQGTVLGQNNSFAIMSSNNIPFEYPVQTGNLAARAYTITATVQILNGAVDPTPLDDVANYSFTLTGGSTGPTLGLSVPLLAGLTAIALGAVGSAVYLVRRRRKDEDTLA